MNWWSDRPIWHVPTVDTVWAVVHFSILPREVKILSCLAAWAGVQMCQCGGWFAWAGVGVGVVVVAVSEAAWGRSDSNNVENTMFARCLLRLVIWTARTAA